MMTEAEREGARAYAEPDPDQYVPKTVFEFPAYRLPVLEEKYLAKINKTAQKLGCPPVTVEVLDRWTVVTPERVPVLVDGFWTNFQRETAEEWVRVKMNGATPKFEGWQFAATLDQRAEGVNLVKANPNLGRDLPERFRSSGRECDHCQKERYRTEVFVLFNEEKNEWTQVGRQCLRDFLGGMDPNQAAQLVEWMDELTADLGASDEDFCGRHGARPEPDLTVQSVMEWAAVSTRVYGFLSKSAVRNGANGRPTADRVQTRLDGSDKWERDRSGDRYTLSGLLEYEVTEADKKFAAETLAWVDTLDPQKNDYQYNLVTLFKTLETVKPKDMGLVCSAVGGYQRFLGLQAKWEAEKAQREARMAGKTAAGFVGTPGQRYAAALRLVDRKEFASEGYSYNDIGKRTLVTFLDESGNVLKWFTGDLAGSMFDVELGTTLDLAFTVKKHEQYKDENQTLVTRVMAPPKKRPPAPPVEAAAPVEASEVPPSAEEASVPTAAPLDEEGSCPRCYPQGCDCSDLERPDPLNDPSELPSGRFCRCGGWASGGDCMCDFE